MARPQAHNPVGGKRCQAVQPYAVVRALATVVRSDDAWDVLDRLAKTYIGPDVTFPAPRSPGFVVRYEVQRVGGVGPWAP